MSPISTISGCGKLFSTVGYPNFQVIATLPKGLLNASMSQLRALAVKDGFDCNSSGAVHLEGVVEDHMDSKWGIRFGGQMVREGLLRVVAANQVVSGAICISKGDRNTVLFE